MLHGFCCERSGEKRPIRGGLCGFEPVDLPFGPVEAATRLAPLGGLVFLDSAVALPGALSLITAAPERILQGNLWHGPDWEAVGAVLRERPGVGADAEFPSAPAGGLFGWVGYDGRFSFGVYPHVLAFDHDSGRWFDYGGLSSALHAVSCLPAPAPAVIPFKPLVGADAFLSAVRRAQEYIAAGDIYQVNLSCPWVATDRNLPFDAVAFYRRLRHVSPAPNAALLLQGGVSVCSASPESFLRMDGRRICTRPIKGTRPRCLENPLEDQRLAAELLASAKERAELLMITDLLRNDLGRVSEFGSIEVPELRRVEAFEQVFHLVSTVTGTLRSEIDHPEAFRACFPGGSITGAPKKRAMEVIAELEPHPRGLYTGAIGYFGFNGRSQFNIAIRTAVHDAAEGLRFHVGAGIVADSDPGREHEETLHKAAGLLQAAGAPSLIPGWSASGSGAA